MLKKKNGFTLIELMTTVAIISIIAAISIPAYQNYRIKSQVLEGFSLISGQKALVAERYATEGKFTYLPEREDITQLGNYVSDMKVDGNWITVYFGNQAHKELHGKFLEMYAYPEKDFDTMEDISDNLYWYCDTDVDKKYAPKTCETYFIENRR